MKCKTVMMEVHTILTNTELKRLLKSAFKPFKGQLTLTQLPKVMDNQPAEEVKACSSP